MCVERFDHHCPWIGSCVGKRNYKYFFGYLVSLACMLVFIAAIIVLSFIKYNENKAFLDLLIINIILSIPCVLGLAFVFVMLAFHTFLSYRNTTTN